MKLQKKKSFWIFFVKVFLFLSFFFFSHCRPESDVSDSPKSISTLSSGQLSGASEARCNSVIAEAEKTNLQTYAAGTPELALAVKSTLEAEGCSSTQAYKDYLAANGISEGSALAGDGTTGSFGDGSTDLSGSTDLYNNTGLYDTTGAVTDANGTVILDSISPSVVDTGITYYFDMDNDGHGSDKEGDVYLYYVPTELYSETNDDCDDSDATVHPDYGEDCEDGIDNDCDGVIDETDYFTDNDQDGYGTSAETTATSSETCLYSPSVYGLEESEQLLKDNYVALNNLDCDDSNPDLHMLKDWYVDQDGDGYGYGAELLIAGGTVQSISQCNAYDLEEMTVGSTSYAANPNDCFDDPSAEDTTSHWGVDKDCDGFHEESSTGDYDCKENEVSLFSQKEDSDCDGVDDFNSEEDQTDACVGLTQDVTAVSYDDYWLDTFAMKRELHSCGHDYDDDGCWAYDSNCSGDLFPNVSSLDSEDCDDGDSSTGSLSRVEGSNYLFTHFLNTWDSEQEDCAEFEFKNPTENKIVESDNGYDASYFGDYYRMQVQIEDGEEATWYDVCLSDTDSSYQILYDNSGQLHNCQDSDKINYYFEIFSKTNASAPWKVDDSLSIRTKELSFGGRLTGEQPSLTFSDTAYSNAYVGVARGSRTLVIRPASDFSDSDEETYAHKVLSFTSGSIMAADSSSEFIDKDGKVYPVVSQSFQLYSNEDGKAMRWGESTMWFLTYTDLDDYVVNIRLIKALCLDDPPDPSPTDEAGVARVQEAFDSGELGMSFENCSHKSSVADDTETTE